MSSSTLGGPRRRPWLLVLALVAGLAVLSPLWATTIRPPAFAELVEEADEVVRARVVELKSYFLEEEGQRLIETAVELEVTAREKGRPAQRVTLRLLGGQVGDETLQVDAMPELQVGDDVILFIDGNGRRICPLVGWGHGVYQVRHDNSTGREFLERVNGEPLTDLGQVQEPLEHRPSARELAQGRPALGPNDLLRAVRREMERQRYVR
jgi:hypothetical protein